MAGFNMASYLELTGNSGIMDAPTLGRLRELVYRHVSTVHYQNYDLLTAKQVLDMTPGALLERLVVQRKCGMCYETSELMYHVVKEFKYDVRRVPVVVLAGMPYDPKAPHDHNILIVYLEGKSYLIDVGFGFNSIRAPVDFSFEKTEEREVYAGERYQLHCGENYYQLNFWLKGEWTSFYRFSRPLNFIDQEGSLSYYRNLVNHPGVAAIRDSVLFVGVVFDKGRYGFSCDYDADKGATNFSLLTVVDGVAESKNLSVEEFVEAIKKYVNVPIAYKIDPQNTIKFL